MEVHGWRLLLSLALALPMLVASAPKVAADDPTVHKRYDGQELRSGLTLGLDGYVRGSGIIMADPAFNHVTEYLSMNDYLHDSIGWAQIGMSQGVGLSATRVHMYAERYACWADPPFYNFVDLGEPPQPNYPLYVYSNGNTAWDVCRGSVQTWYEWSYKVGDINNPPSVRKRMPASQAVPQASQEVSFVFVPENIGQNWWGLTSTGGVNPSFGLHVLTAGGSWDLWSAAAYPADLFHVTVPPNEFNPLVRVPKADYSAFMVHD